jgi:mono/diheme cytochrome c family protein
LPPSSPSNQREKALLAGAIGCVLVIALFSLRTGQVNEVSSTGSVAPRVPVIDPEKVPLVTGEESIQMLFTRPGCPVCHTIPGIPGANGQVGPPLWLGDTGYARLKDPHYRGNAKTLREYIIESIVSPGSYVVPGYPQDTMPTWYGRKLSAGALDKIASYLEDLRRQPAMSPQQSKQ